MIAFISDNAIQADAAEREASLREKVPDLLLSDEHVVLAYKDRGGKGRDSSNFTTKRILITDKQGMTGKKTAYLSVPYGAIRAYSIETAGGLDSDSELKVYASGVGRITMDFVKGADIFALNHHLNEMVLRGSGAGYNAPDGAVAAASVTEGGSGNVFDILGDNASQIDAATVESQLKSTSSGILLPDESVELAFKCGRDSFLLTTKRILKIDVQGFSGSKVEYFTILWPSVRAYSIETAGSFDRDAELRLFTNLPDRNNSSPGHPRKDRTRIDIDFRKGHADIFAVQRFFADKLLGPDTVDASESAVDMSGVADSGSGSLFSWMGDDSRMVDAGAMDAQYHSNPPILQGCERVEMAFKGRRDLMLFTTKRLVFVDMKGFTGKKVEYTSIPWTTVQAYGVKSAGSFVDKDSEMMIWTDFDDCFFPPKANEDDPPPPPIPRMSFLELDFQKDKVDLMAVQRYLSERCLRVEGGTWEDGVYVPNRLPHDVPVSPDVLSPSDPDALTNLLGWIGDDARAIDPAEMDAQMHAEGSPILQADEKVVMAYKAGRDTLIFTTKRVFLIDKKGFSGKRVAYISVPYTSIRAFAVESAGSFDSDSEVKLWTKTYWSVEGGIGNKFDQDLRKGKADIIAIQSYLATQTIGASDGTSSLAPGATAAEAGGLDTFLSFIGDDGVALDPATVEEKLKSSPPLLQSDEKVDACYKIGRDMCVFTTKRIMMVDRQGITGKRIEYRSFPLRYVRAFQVRTAGHLLSSAEVTIYSDGSKSIDQDLAKSSSDIWAVQTILANKALK